MKSPTLMIVAAVLVVVGSGMVAAQLNESPEYEKPVDRQWDEGSCHTKMVAALYDATDITDPAQDKHLKAAEAYRLLDVAGQRCE